MLREICFDMADEFFSGFNALDEKLSPTEKLMFALENHLHVMENSEDSFFVFMNDWRHLSEPYLSQFKTLRKKYEQRFERIIEEGIMKKEFVKLDSALTAQIILSSINASINWFNPKKMNPEVFSKHLITLLANGILK